MSVIGEAFFAGTLRSLLFNELGDLLQMAAKSGTAKSNRQPRLVGHRGRKRHHPLAAGRCSAAPIGSQRHAALIPRDPNPPPLALADPEIIRPELERLVSELLPEVVQAVLRHNWCIRLAPEAVETRLLDFETQSKRGFGLIRQKWVGGRLRL